MGQPPSLYFYIQCALMLFISSSLVHTHRPHHSSSLVYTLSLLLLLIHLQYLHNPPRQATSALYSQCIKLRPNLTTTGLNPGGTKVCYRRCDGFAHFSSRSEKTHCELSSITSTSFLNVDSLQIYKDCKQL